MGGDVEVIELETERLRLRQWRDADLDPFATLNADPQVMEFFESTLAREESDAMGKRCRELILERGYGFWALERKATGAFIGFTGLHIPAAPLPFQPCVEVGWRLGRAHWGKGFATEAARAALGAGFDRLGLTEIVSFAVVANLRSISVMERLGMRPDGQFDHPSVPEGSPHRRHVLYRLHAKDRSMPGD